MLTRETIGSNLARKIDNVLTIIEAWETRSVSDIAVAMNVSNSTAKKYLQILESAGQVRREAGAWVAA